MWRNGNRIHFQTTIVENDSKVLTGAYMDLTEVKAAPSIMSNLCSAKHVDSDAVFGQIEEYVKANTAQVKKINGVFHFIITIKGQPEADWVLDLKKGVVYKGKPDGKVDTTLTIDDKDMIQMALGKLNPQMAFMKGKLKIKGNIMLTQKIRTLLEANRPKL